MPPSKPSYKSDSAAWLKHWEREYDAIFGTSMTFSMTPGRRIIKLHDELPSVLYTAALEDSLLQNLHTIQSQICTLQRDLSKKSSLRYAEDDFVQRWTQECTPQERKDWILEGLFRTCESSPDFEDHMRFCPEIAMKRLNNNSGKGFLDLLEKLMLQDIETIPTDVQRVPNPIFEAMNTPLDPRGRLLSKLIDLQRNGFLTYFVWNTLLAFYGEREEYGLLKAGKHGISREFREYARQDKDFSRLLKKTEKESKSNAILAQRGCNTCGRTAEKADVEMLLACPRCRKIGRNVFYCGKECQVKDWKTGRPPHKTICGNTDALANAVLGSDTATNSSEDEGKSGKDSDRGGRWGQPQPGYNRSPALLHQLSFLDQNPDMDYVFVRPSPHPDHGIKLVDPSGQLFFVLMMRRAVNSFSPVEVCRMYDMLLPFAEKVTEIGKEGLKRQLQKEYGVDMDEWLPKVQQHVDEQLMKEGKTREQNQKEINEKYADMMKSVKI